jgi:hypothetical protein
MFTTTGQSALYCDAMSPKLKHIVSNVYGFAVITVCLFVAVATGGYAWSERTRSKTNAGTFAVVALFFIYIAAVLVFQAVRGREYERVITSLGFVPLDWKNVPFSEALPAVFANKKQPFLGRVIHGEACGRHVYHFICAGDAAWWSKKKTTVVMEGPQALTTGEGLAARLAEKGDAELAFHNRWCMIQARHEIGPTALPEWLETVVSITAGS